MQFLCPSHSFLLFFLFPVLFSPSVSFKFHRWSGSGEKSPSKGVEIFFPTLKFVTIRFFLLENPSHWGLETVVCPIFAEPFLDIFSVYLLVPRTNLSHSQQQSYLCPKIKISYLIKADLRLLLSYTD